MTVITQPCERAGLQRPVIIVPVPVATLKAPLQEQTILYLSEFTGKEHSASSFAT
jgi:hypothetical protein